MVKLLGFKRPLRLPVPKVDIIQEVVIPELPKILEIKPEPVVLPVVVPEVVAVVVPEVLPEPTA